MKMNKPPSKDEVVEVKAFRPAPCFDDVNQKACAFYNYKCPTWAKAICKRGLIMFAMKSNPPNVRDHRAGRCDVAKQKGSLWPAPVHRLVGRLFNYNNCSSQLSKFFNSGLTTPGFSRYFL